MEKSKKNEDVLDDNENIEKPSYTYWKRESDKPFSNEFVPQKSNSNLERQENNQNSGGSAWNKAGTWYNEL